MAFPGYGTVLKRGEVVASHGKRCLEPLSPHRELEHLAPEALYGARPESTLADTSVGSGVTSTLREIGPDKSRRRRLSEEFLRRPAIEVDEQT